MPDVVLRHPALPHQPVVISIAVGEFVPESYQASGWAIDTTTAPEDALAEAAATAVAAAAAAAEAAVDFEPSFPPASDSTLVTPSVPVAPAPPTAASSTPTSTTPPSTSASSTSGSEN